MDLTRDGFTIKIIQLWGLKHFCLLVLGSAMAATVQHMADGMIVAGWDKYDGGSVYGIPLGGTLLRLPFSSGGL